MQEELVERYVKTIRKLSISLMIWNIIGVVFNGVFGGIAVILLNPDFQQQIQKAMAEQGETLPDGMLDSMTNLGIGGIFMLILAILGILASWLYGRIAKNAKRLEMSSQNLLIMAIIIHVYSVVSMVFTDIRFSSGTSFGAFICPLVIAGLIGWLYMTYRKLAEEVGGATSE